MPEYRPGAIINTTQSEQCHAFPNRTRLSINILLRFLRSPPPLMAVWKPCIIRSVLLILLNSRTSKLQLQPDLTTIRESQPLENPQMTTNRESQSPISAQSIRGRSQSGDGSLIVLSIREPSPDCFKIVSILYLGTTLPFDIVSVTESTILNPHLL